MHIEILPPILNGFVVPSQNVATPAQGAFVSGGVNREKLLNGKTQPTTGNVDCTYHKLNPESKILIQLSQPYNIGSLRLRLWDLDDRSYRFFIETSANYSNWIRVCDNTKEGATGWQTIAFEPRAVSFIRIVGTASSSTDEVIFFEFREISD